MNDCRKILAKRFANGGVGLHVEGETPTIMIGVSVPERDMIVAALRSAAAEDALADKERELADLIARYYRQEIGCSMQQAEHWAKENFPLAVHHRVRKADAYYQVVALCERFADWNENPFDAMRDALKRGLIKPAGAYPPSAEIHAYRHPAFVVEKLKTASKAAGGQA